jgi:phage terminase Nu1 subunit (DNA packaging protein)
MTSSNPHGLPAQPPERYVSRKQLADIMGLSIRTVDRLVSLGLPSVTWGVRARRFLPSQAIAWARERESTARPDGPH